MFKNATDHTHEHTDKQQPKLSALRDTSGLSAKPYGGIARSEPSWAITTDGTGLRRSRSFEERHLG